MLAAHFGQEFSGWSGASGSYIFMTSADAFKSFLEVLALPFKICG